MSENNGYHKVLKDEQSLAIFLRGMAKFDRHFCDLMTSDVEWTLRLEIKGANRKLVHCRVNEDELELNRGSEHKKRSRSTRFTG